MAASEVCALQKRFNLEIFYILTI